MGYTWHKLDKKSTASNTILAQMKKRPYGFYQNCEVHKKNVVSWDVIGSVVCIVYLKECVGVNGKRFILTDITHATTDVTIFILKS